MKDSEFVCDCVDGLHYKCNKINLNRGRSYIDYPEAIKNKKTTINPKNNNDMCFQYAVTAALNQETIEKNLQRITKIKLFIDSANGKK